MRLALVEGKLVINIRCSCFNKFFSSDYSIYSPIIFLVTLVFLNISRIWRAIKNVIDSVRESIEEMQKDIQDIKAKYAFSYEV